MSFKRKAMEQAMKLMSSPTVGKMMQNPKVMQAMMTAMSLPGKVQAHLDQGKRNLARALNLATREEVEGLRNTLEHLQRENQDLRRGSGNGGR